MAYTILHLPTMSYVGGLFLPIEFCDVAYDILSFLRYRIRYRTCMSALYDVDIRRPGQYRYYTISSSVYDMTVYHTMWRTTWLTWHCGGQDRPLLIVLTLSAVYKGVFKLKLDERLKDLLEKKTNWLYIRLCLDYRKLEEGSPSCTYTSYFKKCFG